MQKWEYKIVTRWRGWKGGLGIRETGDWDKDIDRALAEMGNAGWELVAVEPRSDYVDEACAGTTTSDNWIFKRPAQG